MRHARTYRWTRMRRCDERSKPAGLLPLRPFCPGCTISTRGYDFREGQATIGEREAGFRSLKDAWADTLNSTYICRRCLDLPQYKRDDEAQSKALARPGGIGRERSPLFGATPRRDNFERSVYGIALPGRL
jgi:hypothetical protein